jgi:Xaa-Pro dipeptidase
MTLHFTREEFAERQRRACAHMEHHGLDGLLIFRQESMFYLTGYDTGGYSMFQGMYMTSDGRIALLTRTADRLQSRMTSVIEDIRIWIDGDDAKPADELREMMRDYDAEGKRVGVEYHAYGLTAQRGKMVDAALEDFCTVIDGSDVIREIRLVKSEAELVFVRRAGELCDDAWRVANSMTAPGEFLGNVYGEMQNVIMRGDGDPSASVWPMGAGENALLVRYHTGKETVGPQDQVTHEFAAAFRHYHACAMSTVVTGTASDKQLDMAKACAEALDHVEETLKAGNTVGDLYAAHAQVFDRTGYGHAKLAACGYTLGISYPPSWMDWPMIWKDNPQVLEAGMVFFMHMILLDDTTGLTVSLGETAIITEGACQPICHAPRQLLVN